MAGLDIAMIADLDPERAAAACRTVGWDAARLARTVFIASGSEACAHPDAEVIVEATGNPAAGIAHVFVNGIAVWQEGAHTGARPGRALRRQAMQREAAA